MDITPYTQSFQSLKSTLQTGSILAFFMPLPLQSRAMNAIIGTLGNFMGRYLHLSTWQQISEIVIGRAFQLSLPLGLYPFLYVFWNFSLQQRSRL
jgi:hypothetical protein